jgi:hypothetical protein
MNRTLAFVVCFQGQGSHGNLLFNRLGSHFTMKFWILINPHFLGSFVISLCALFLTFLGTVLPFSLHSWILGDEIFHVLVYLFALRFGKCYFGASWRKVSFLPFLLFWRNKSTPVKEL